MDRFECISQQRRDDSGRPQRGGHALDTGQGHTDDLLFRGVDKFTCLDLGFQRLPYGLGLRLGEPGRVAVHVRAPLEQIFPGDVTHITRSLSPTIPVRRAPQRRFGTDRSDSSAEARQ